VYAKAGRAAQGLADVEHALKLAPDEAQVFDARGHIFEALGRRDEAIADFRRALEIEPFLRSSQDALKRLEGTVGRQSPVGRHGRSRGRRNAPWTGCWVSLRSTRPTEAGSTTGPRQAA
jgi:tetratricopeptide (TPR) repeat protein